MSAPHATNPVRFRPNGVISRRLGVSTTPVHDNADLVRFFDRYAPSYTDQHGDHRRLLEYRVGLIRRYAGVRPSDVVLDVGCGTGDHLYALSSEITRGIGVDLSPRMIDVARARMVNRCPDAPLRFHVDNGEELRHVAAASVTLVLCIGALEHMLDKSAVLESVHRVLVPGGRFFCLTPDAGFVWYRTIAPALGFATNHLSSDRFLTRCELRKLLREAGYGRARCGSWTFIPRGDMPPILGLLLTGMELIGRVGRIAALRGGLWALGHKK